MILAGRQPGAGEHASREYWRRLLSHRNVPALCLMYFRTAMRFISASPGCRRISREARIRRGIARLLAGMPLILSIAGDLLGGVTTDRVSARFGLRVGRSGVGAAAYILAGTAMIFAALTISLSWRRC